MHYELVLNLIDNLVIQDTTYELSEVLYKESNNPHVYFINSKC